MIILAPFAASQWVSETDTCLNKFQEFKDLGGHSIDVKEELSVDTTSVVECQEECCKDEQCTGYEFRIRKNGDVECNLYHKDLVSASVKNELDSDTHQYFVKRRPGFRTTAKDCPEGKECLLNMIAYMYPMVVFDDCPMIDMECDNGSVDYDSAFVKFDEFIVPLGECVDVFDYPSILECIGNNLIHWRQFENADCTGEETVSNMIENGNTCVTGVRPTRYTIAWDGACTDYPVPDRPDFRPCENDYMLFGRVRKSDAKTAAIDDMSDACECRTFCKESEDLLSEDNETMTAYAFTYNPNQSKCTCYTGTGIQLEKDESKNDYVGFV